MRIRTKALTCPADTKPAYQLVTQTAFKPRVTVQAYLPAHTIETHTCQDFNHARCYPNCGGPAVIYSTRLDYRPFSWKRGYDYKYSNYETCSYSTGAYVKPRTTFTFLDDSSAVVNPFTGDLSEPNDISGSLNSLSDIGSKAYNRFRPKLEKMNFIESLSELPKTCASLTSRAFKAQKRAGRFGNAYVQSEFFWLPLVRDVRAFIDICLNTEMHINRLVKGNGRWLRRGGLVNEETLSGSVDIKLDNSLIRPSVGHITSAKHGGFIKIKDTFTGVFRYYVPGISRKTYLGRLMALNTLCGFRLTPSNIYNAMPWSWLLDWTTGAGDWVDNYSSTTADDCVCKYAFVKRVVDAESTVTVTASDYFKTLGSSTPVYGSGSTTYKVNKMIRSYAEMCFSLSGGSLTTRQALILHSIMRN